MQGFLYLILMIFVFSNEALNISDGIEEPGMVQWDLFGCLIVAWIVVYGVIWKGLHNSGKVWIRILLLWFK